MILKSIVEKSNSPWALFKNTSSPLSADAFVKARVLSVGVQTATSEHNKSSYNKPEYAALSPYLGATIYSVGANSAFIYSNSGSGVSLGVLKKKVDDGTYYVENTYKNMPAISVTYKDK